MEIPIKDVQGLVFSGYGKYMMCCTYFLIKINESNDARAWLKYILDQAMISNCIETTEDDEFRLNLAISKTGLEKIGLEPDIINGFDQAFKDGMQSEYRALKLGDSGQNSPKNWLWGGIENNQVDLLVMLYSKNTEIHTFNKTNHQKIFGQYNLNVIHIEDTTEIERESNFVKEHFGFADAISDPKVEGFPSKKKEKTIATGEILLGYPNQYDIESPDLQIKEHEFRKNGTYLVLRQLKQDVAGFWSFIRNEADRLNVPEEYLAAKMVGRWKNGSLFTEEQVVMPNTVKNDFDFREDQHGYGCPMGAHIRRANPRASALAESPDESLKVSNRHRIARRGRPYGEYSSNPYIDDMKERGLMFVSLNANIERQFEFIQHSWINNQKFAGLYDEQDPLIGVTDTFTIQNKPFFQQVQGIKQFVTTVGGAYFFLPSLPALTELANIKT